VVRSGMPARSGVLAFEHVFDEDAALSNFLVDDELLVIGGDEEDHCYSKWLTRRKEMEMEKKRGTPRVTEREYRFQGAVSLRKPSPLSPTHPSA